MWYSDVALRLKPHSKRTDSLAEEIKSTCLNIFESVSEVLYSCTKPMYMPNDDLSGMVVSWEIESALQLHHNICMSLFCGPNNPKSPNESILLDSY